jgi:hypothetical protein
MRPALYAGAVILLAWAVPTALIAGAAISWVHLASLLMIMPSAWCGARLAGKFRRLTLRAGSVR